MPLRPTLHPLLALALVAASSNLALAQQTSPSRVRGTIESVDGETLMVKSRSGEDVKLTMAGDIRVVAFEEGSPGDLDSLEAGVDRRDSRFISGETASLAEWTARW